jgi:hypothetical protein
VKAHRVKGVIVRTYLVDCVHERFHPQQVLHQLLLQAGISPVFLGGHLQVVLFHVEELDHPAALEQRLRASL